MSRKYRITEYAATPEVVRLLGDVCELVGGYAERAGDSARAARVRQFDPFDVADLSAAHGKLFGGEIPGAGGYRERETKIFKGSYVTYIPPSPHQIRGMIADLFEWLDDREEHPIIASCICHYQLLLVHPFPDGNGRLARYWQDLLLEEWRPEVGAYGVEYAVGARKADYLLAIGAADRQKDAAPFVAFMLSLLREELRRKLEKLERRTTMPQSAAGEAPRLSEFAERLLGAFEGRAMTGAQIMKALGLSHRGTFRKNYLDPALEAGYVEMTQPDSPRSPTQKYRLTRAGQSVTPGA